jgi:hypothetical protein
MFWNFETFNEFSSGKASSTQNAVKELNFLLKSAEQMEY